MDSCRFIECNILTRQGTSPTKNHSSTRNMKLSCTTRVGVGTHELMYTSGEPERLSVFEQGETALFLSTWSSVSPLNYMTWGSY